jgi:hypothetical protein
MSDYKRQITVVKGAIDKLGNLMLAETSLEVLRQVSQQTPVDTGRARSNWFMGINAAERKTTEDTSGANVGQAEGVMLTIKGADTVFVSNNLPYIERLNDGYSKQAPANFVEGAAQIARRKVEEIAKRGLPK